MITLEVKNARIKSTELGFSDHGIMTFWLHLTYGESSGQGAGGLALDDIPIEQYGHDRVATKEGMDMIMQILRTVGVSNWEDLPGKYIRVKATHNEVHAIAHPLDDKWLIFKDVFKE